MSNNVLNTIMTDEAKLEGLKNLENIITSFHKNNQHHIGQLLAKIMNIPYEIETKHIKVKLSCNWADTKTITNLWNKMSENNNFSWGKIRLITGNEEPDYYVVINGTNDQINPSKTIVFHMEPYIEKLTFLNNWRFAKEPMFLKVLSHDKEYNNNEWHLSLSYSELLKKEIEVKN